MITSDQPKHLPGKRNYTLFALFTILLFWVAWLLEWLTPLRIGHSQRDAMSWIVPAVATPVMIFSTWFRYWRAKMFAAGAIEVVGVVTGIARSGAGVHRRVRLRYECNERTYEKSVPIYESIVRHLQIDSQIPS